MDFSLTEEQLLLQQSLNRFISDHCDVERHRRLSKTSQGFDPAVWRQFADLGWLAVPFSEALGGMGGNAVDLMVVGEALGAMQVLLDKTVEYTRTREQFGQPIGKFQALQHRMADMYLKVEETRSLLLNAAIQLQEDSQDGAAACAALKVKLCEAGKFVSQQAVQLHGGIGMTDELAVGHHFKRLMLLSKLYGDEVHFLQRYADLAGTGTAAVAV